MHVIKVHRRLLKRLILPVVGSVMIAACATEPGTYAPPVATPAAFSSGGTVPLPERWWHSFDDPVLNDLIDKALANNFSLRAAWARLAQSRATLAKQQSSFLPTLDLNSGVSGSKQRSRSSAANGGDWKVSSSSEFELGLSSGYEIDLWGGIASAVDAADLDARASEEDLRTAAITLSAEVAKTWYALVEQYGQVDLLKSQLATNEQVLELTDLRFRQGQVMITDILQQQQTVESIRGTLATAESDLAVTRHALAILLGQTPADAEIPVINDLVPLPPLPATGVPADLVRQRPDIRKAYADLSAADRRVGVAIADRYPSFSLSANVSTSAENVRDLLDNWLASLAANIVAPIFEAGARKAELERTRAVVDESLADYGQAILDALGEVEDALVQESRQQAYIASLERQMELSDQVIQRMLDRYSGGDVDYISVLDALLTNQNLERTRLTASRQLLEYRIDLCRALGGGWVMERPETLSGVVRGEVES